MVANAEENIGAEMPYHWKDGWMFERTKDGMHIYNETCAVDLVIPHNEWLSILKATDSLEQALSKVVFAR